MSSIKDRIAKLLALTESPEPEEAKLAMLKAQELMVKYKIKQGEVVARKNVKVIRKTTGITCTKMTNTWAACLSGVIAEHYCCKAYRSRAYQAKKVEIGFIGLEGDFEICCSVFKYAFSCVKRVTDGIGEKYKGVYTPAYIRMIANSYGFGFAYGLSDALRLQEEQNKEEWGLVLTTPKEVIDSMSDMGRPSTYGSMERNEHTLGFINEGYRDGLKFDLSSVGPNGEPRVLCEGTV